MRRHFLGLWPAFAGTLALSMFSVAHAYTPVYPSGTGGVVPTTITSYSQVVVFLCSLVVWIFWGLIVLAVAMFLVGGYRYATSGGDAERVHSANRTLLYAAVATAVALMAAGLPYLIDSFVNGGIYSIGQVCGPIF